MARKDKTHDTNSATPEEPAGTDGQPEPAPGGDGAPGAAPVAPGAGSGSPGSGVGAPGASGVATPKGKDKAARRVTAGTARPAEPTSQKRRTRKRRRSREEIEREAEAERKRREQEDRERIRAEAARLKPHAKLLVRGVAYPVCGVPDPNAPEPEWPEYITGFLPPPLADHEEDLVAQLVADYMAASDSDLPPGMALAFGVGSVLLPRVLALFNRWLQARQKASKAMPPPDQRTARARQLSIQDAPSERPPR